MWRSNEKLNSGFEYFGVEKLEFKISHYGLKFHITEIARRTPRKVVRKFLEGIERLWYNI